MEYNDETLLTAEKYETMAKAYANALKEKGLMIVRVGNGRNEELEKEILSLLSNIRACLFRLGGFLNTTKMYSLNERQIKKICIILDNDTLPSPSIKIMDKTKCFLSFLGYEFQLIKKLIDLRDQSNFESNISRIIDERLTLLSQIFTL